MKRTELPINGEPPLVSVVIPTYNRREDLRVCLESVFAQNYAQYEVLVIDDSSNDGTKEMIKANFPAVVYVEKHQRTGVSGTKNLGINRSHGQYVWFLDSDAQVPNSSVMENFVSIFEMDDSIGSAGGEMIDVGGNRYLRIFRILNNELRFLISEIDDSFKLKQVEWLTTCNCFVRRALLIEIGGFEEEYFYCCEDSELSMRIRKLGYRIVVDPGVFVLHKRSNVSRVANYKLFHVNRIRFLIKSYGPFILPLLPFIEAWSILKSARLFTTIDLKDLRGVSEEDRSKLCGKFTLGLSYLLWFVYGYFWNVVMLPMTLKSKYRPKNYLSSV